MALLGEFPSDEPQTDREWLTRIAGDVKSIKNKLEGKGGVCDTLKQSQIEIDELKKWRIYQTVLLIGLLVLIGGRYVFGPTSIPLVP
jgi:hypothetical protein